MTLKHVDLAAKTLGESKATHLARAGGYRQRLLLAKAENEYREALKVEPDNAELRIALAQTLLGEKHYDAAIKALQDTLGVTDEHAYIYAALANASAHLKRKDDAYRYIAEAEKESGDSAPVLLASGDSLLALGDNSAAMEHYARALSAPDASRVDVRLSFARTFQAQGKWADARQQIALAFTEARIADGSPITPDNLATAAAIFLSMNDFDLATQYYQMAQDAGADERPVRIGLANTYLAQGDFKQANAELNGLGSEADNVADYDYQMAYGSLNRQQHKNVPAMMGFARAHELSLEDENAERALHEVAGDEGYPIAPNIGMSSDVHVQPIFEDATVYDLDAKIRGISDPSLLPSPRSSVETLAASTYHMHFGKLPTLIGEYSLRNAVGQFVFPSDTLSVFNRNTFDTNVGIGVNPVFRVGNVSISITPGMQFTLRRDKDTPFDLNQDLFRSYIYMSTSSLFNWIAIKGDFIHEIGPFTERNLSSSEKSGAIEFTVGRPWGKTALITGYRARDLQFDPTRREFFTTSTYAGLQRRFGQKATVGVFGEYIRSWRVDINTFAIAQAMRPAAQFSYRVNNRWQFEATAAYTREMGSPIYDNMNTGLLVSYTRPLGRTWSDAAGPARIEFPLKLSFGLQQQQFPNFTGTKKSSFVPVIRLSIF
jgi:Tfp pilus assembly protein PilF